MSRHGPAHADELARLAAHLRAWLGAWEPGEAGTRVVACEVRTRPGWDGQVRPLVGAADGEGHVVLAVDPAVHTDVSTVAEGLTLDELRSDEVAAAVGAAAGVDGARLGAGTMRFLTSPHDVHDDVDDLGTWLDHRDPRVPEWLHPFGGTALVALEGDRVAAGVGVKRHDPSGHELAVVTEEGFRGRGLATRLVAAAARHELARVPVVTYLHGPDNVGSARVAEAVGFHERGWHVIGLFGAGQSG